MLYQNRQNQAISKIVISIINVMYKESSRITVIDTRLYPLLYIWRDNLKKNQLVAPTKQPPDNKATGQYMVSVVLM